MISYFILSTIILFLSFGVYRLLLKQEKAFHFNRIYLILTLFFSFTFPLIEFESEQVSKLISSSEIIQENFSPLVDESESTLIKVSSLPNQGMDSLFLILYCVYGTISLVFLTRFLRNLSSLLKLISKNRILKNDLNIVLIKEDISPFSFFKYLFLNRSKYDNGLISKEILAHESIHGKQMHSLDILFIEVCLILFWFNPILWLYKNEISENHEYLADDALLKRGINSQEYSNTILNSISTINQQALSCGFSFIQTKNRIKMLNKKKSTFLKISGKIAFATLLISTALAISSYSYKEVIKPVSSQKYKVIIDAGHGGKDNGATEGTLIEKEVTLSIIKKIIELDKNKGLEIIYTRIDDRFIELDERINVANSVEADLFISLHVNSGPSHINGLEIYLPEDSIAYERSIDAGTLMGMYIASKSKFSEFGTKRASFRVLKEIEIPTFLIELGYMTNEEDAALLQQVEIIDQIANSIYTGLIDLKNGNSQMR
jgi:N-acetylmuramoyl-L-alanine amidase